MAQPRYRRTNNVVPQYGDYFDDGGQALPAAPQQQRPLRERIGRTLKREVPIALDSLNALPFTAGVAAGGRMLSSATARAPRAAEGLADMLASNPLKRREVRQQLGGYVSGRAKLEGLTREARQAGNITELDRLDGLRRAFHQRPAMSRAVLRQTQQRLRTPSPVRSSPRDVVLDQLSQFAQYAPGTGRLASNIAYRFRDRDEDQ